LRMRLQETAESHSGISRVVIPALLRSCVFSLCLILIMTMGCGYRLRSTAEPIGISIASLSIPLIQSTSSSLGFEAEFTRVIREEFISHSKIPLVPRDEAAKVLIGTVVDIKEEPLSYAVEKGASEGTTYSVTSARKLRIKLHVKLVDRETGKIIWEDKCMEEQANFTVVTDPPDSLKTRYNQRKAVLIIAQNLANRIYLKTMDRF